ncbi:hypothetical protein SK128_019360, partial [Halocaridina rubra]
SKFDEATANRDTFVILNALLHKNIVPSLLAHNNLSELTEMFATFFSDKIATV